MDTTGRRRGAAVVVASVAVVTAVVVVVVLLTRGEPDPEPVAIVDAELVAGNRVEVVIDRCESEPRLERTSLAEARLVVEVVASGGSDEGCQDRLEVATVTDDVLELEDATSGAVFVLRVVPPERPNRPPGTRQ